ncbi:MAG TPA: hypothetical protein VJM53_04295 [Burkholderiales bacterium]|nr:hypothetical protein [Burkholderiales bacterium]
MDAQQSEESQSKEDRPKQIACKLCQSVRCTWVPVLILIFFAIAVFALGNDWPGHQFVAKIAMGAVGFGFAIWFIVTFAVRFKAEDEIEMRRQLSAHFQFAYVFTFISFALLTLPFTILVEEQVDSDAAPIKLIRGCVNSDQRASEGKESLIPYCDKAPVVSANAAEVEKAWRTFPWLLSIGGIKGVAREMQYPETDKKETKPKYYYEIESGFYVPLYVVLLAFIGGAVSLSRRIPEYQKRIDPDYIEVPPAFVLKPCDARESVVFQIMQLITAPFIAITIFFAIEPETIAASIALAFASGFASETILLMIRGMVEGIKPQTSVPKKPEVGSLKVHVSKGGKGVEGAKIYLDGEGKPRLTTSKGGWALVSQLSVGTHRVKAEFNDEQKDEEVKIELDKTTELKIVL